MSRPSLLASSLALLVFSLAPKASAQLSWDAGDPSRPPPAAPPAADTPNEPEGKDTPWDKAPRPWLYAADPTQPPPGHVITSLSVGYAQTNRGAARPFAADVAHAGAVFSGAVDVGIVKYFGAHAEGLIAGQAGTGNPLSAGAVIGVSAFPLGGRGPVDIAVSAGYLRELGGANGLWFRGAIAGDVGRVRLSATALGEHVFESERDEIDVLLTAGASVKATDWLRFGTEYVVQDLEGAWDPEEADGGIRHFLGANAALLLGRRVQLSLGPALGLSPNSPRVLGRLMAAYSF